MGKGSRFNSVPDRWENYSPMGEVIPGTRFICFKVPLREGISNKVAPEARFMPSHVIRGIPEGHELGLVIDLTNTERYYDPRDFSDCAIEHKKIKCAGHDVAPDEAEWTQFRHAVDDYLKKDDHRLIGVHCTHGVNRTGFLVCRYLIQRSGLSPREAIKLFCESRGHPLEKYHNLLLNMDSEASQGSDVPAVQ